MKIKDIQLRNNNFSIHNGISYIKDGLLSRDYNEKAWANSNNKGYGYYKKDKSHCLKSSAHAYKHSLFGKQYGDDFKIEYVNNLLRLLELKIIDKEDCASHYSNVGFYEKNPDFLYGDDEHYNKRYNKQSINDILRFEKGGMYNLLCYSHIQPYRTIEDAENRYGYKSHAYYKIIYQSIEDNWTLFMKVGKGNADEGNCE